MNKILAAKIKTKDILHRITGKETKQEKAKRNFIKCYKHTSDPEILEMVSYIKQTGQFGMINKHLKNDYENFIPDVKKDTDRNLFYVLDNHRPIYWAKKLDEKEIGNQYKGIKVEQDPYSPHCYLDEDDIRYIKQFKLNGGKIVSIECGAMEGMFTRELVDLIDDAYMFECEEDWKEALCATFSDYQERTHIVSKYVSNVTNENMVSIDSYFADMGGGKSG